MKKIICILMSMILLTGCTAKKPEVEETASPTLETVMHASTPEEKILNMIQSCIRSYNEKKTEELEKELDLSITPLPLEVSSLPEISSLDDLEEVKNDNTVSNAYFTGKQKIDDKYSAVYTIYSPGGGSFWSNGSVSFEADPEQITEDDPQFNDCRNAINDLLKKEKSLLDELYAISISVDESKADENGYCPVTEGPDSIQQLKNDAAAVFTQDYIESSIDPVVFSGSSPVYMEKNGKLYAHPTDMIQQPSAYSYDTHHIAAVKDDGTQVEIDLLISAMGQPTGKLTRMVLVHSGNAYLLPTVY